MTKEKKIITYSSMVICFLLIFIYCLSPFAVGLNHSGANSEFEKSVGLVGANDGYFYTGYLIAESEGSGYGSLYMTVKPIVAAVRVVSDYFDIRILSFIYMVILLLSVFYLNKYVKFKNNVADIIFAALTIFIAFDLSYLLYLNTLYAEGMFYVLFIFAISLYIKLINSEKPQIPTTVAFCIAAAMICSLKASFIPLILPFLFMMVFLILKRKDVIYRILTVVMAIAVVICPMMCFKGFKADSSDKFHSVFYGILYENEDVKNTLDKLEIDEKYGVLAGKNHYDNLEFDINSEEFKNDVTDKISYGKVVKYYVTNPSAYINQFKYVGWNAFETSPKYVGNYSASSGKGAYETAKGFTLFNTVKSKLFPKNLWFFYLVPLLLIAVLIGYRKKFNFGYVVLGISLAIMNIILFNIPMITGGLVDISRTMAVYNISFDIIVIMLIMCMIYISTKRKQEFKEQYGLTQ